MFKDEADIFRGTVTIDPSEVGHSWARLSRNITSLELGLLPKWLHLVLIGTLQRKAGERGHRRHGR